MTADDVALWGERAGAGQPVVLLHGLADDHGLWRHVVGRLDGVETLAIDLPGHGSSGPIPAGATLSWMTDQVVGRITTAFAEPVTLVGLSMGGGIAQLVALDHPEFVGRLVLVSTSPVFPAATRQRFIDRAVRAERDGMAAVVDETVPRWFTAEWMAAHPEEVERTAAAVLATDPVAFARASRLNAERDLLDRLGEIRVPVLFIGGLDDPADPDRAARQYADRVADVRIEMMAGVSHLLPVEAPEAFLAILRSFLTDHRPTPSSENEVQP